MGVPVKISAIIITLNEGKNIERCLLSLTGLADEIVVVDSISTDNTKDICLKYNVRFIEQPFLGYIEQKNFAVSQAAYDHVLALDADEALSEKLKGEIIQVKNNWQGDGYYLKRFNNYCGKWIRHCGYYPEWKLRLWNRAKGQWGGTNPHDKVTLAEGSRTGKLQNDLLHYAYESVDQHLEQMYKFGIIAARAKFREGKKANFLVHVIGSPFFKFIKKYFFQLGFLDGYYGFVFCSAASSLNFFKYLRLYEYNRKGKAE